MKLLGCIDGGMVYAPQEFASHHGTSTPLADQPPQPPATMRLPMLWASVRAAGRRCRWGIIQNIAFCVENEDIDRSIYYLCTWNVRRITQQINASRGVNRLMICKEGICNIVELLGGRRSHLIRYIRPTRLCSDHAADDVIVIFNGVSPLCYWHRYPQWSTQ